MKCLTAKQVSNKRWESVFNIISANWSSAKMSLLTLPLLISTFTSVWNYSLCNHIMNWNKKLLWLNANLAETWCSTRAVLPATACVSTKAVAV